MISFKKKIVRKGIIVLASAILFLGVLAAITILKTRGRTLIQVDIHQNKKLIYLSNFSEPPQFAIWLENPETHECKTMFVTHRVSVGDWEGKANVPVALPQWFKLFRGDVKSSIVLDKKKNTQLAVTGATPKGDYFSVRAEVKPGSEWICWIEMNLAGDFNETFREFDREKFEEDEFSCGQPALLYKADVKAVENMKFVPVLNAQSIWDNGVASTEPVSEGVTTAKNVFDTIRISVIRPKPKLIEKYKIKDQKI